MLPALAATADPQVTPTSIPSPVMVPVAQPKPVAPVTQAKPIAPASPISTTSMPSPQMITPSSAAPKTPDITGYIKAAQQQGISSDDIYSHLKQLGYVDSTGAISNTKQAAPAKPQIGDIASGAANAAKDYAGNVTTAAQQGVEEMHDAMARAGSGEEPIEPALELGAGALDAVTSPISGAISPVLSPIIKAISDHLSNSPTLQAFAGSKSGEVASRIAQDVLNASKLASAPAGAESGPEISAAAKTGTDAVSSGIDTAVNAVKNTASSIKDSTSGIIDKAKDIATPNAHPTMQTLIDRVKDDPVQAKNVAENTKGYIKTAQDAAKTTGAKTAPEVAAGQFKTAMTKLRAKMGTVGESTKTSLAPVANARASGVSSILQNLKAMTADRLGAEYTPMTDSINADTMKGMNFSQRVGLLNDVLDGKSPSPFENGEDMFRPAEGREMGVNDGPDLKALGNLHETVNNLGDNPTVQQLNDVVNRLQSTLYKARQVGAEPIDSQIKGMIKQVAGQLNETAKSTASAAEKEQGIPEGTYADANAKYSELASLQENMSRILGAGYKNGASVIKAIFSPQNRGLNPLITKLEQETGVPIFDHATMANFATRLAGDPRMTSLLEKNLGNAQNVAGFWKALGDFDITKPIGSAANVVRGAGHFLQDPEGKVMRQLGQDNKPSILDQKPDIGAGLSTKDITSKLNNADKSLMQKYIDNVRVPESSAAHTMLTRSEEADVFKMNELLGINSNTSAQAIANKYEQILSGKK